jgi:Tol biopolymer transport system component
VRIDAEQFSRSRMSYYTGLSIVPSDVLVPAPPEAMMEVTGYPAGAWLNYVTWSPDGSYIAFTTRSPGMWTGAGHDVTVSRDWLLQQH